MKVGNALRWRARKAVSALAGRLGLETVHRSAYRYRRDGLLSKHACEFLDDPRFLAAYAAGEATGSWRGAAVQWRVHVLCWAGTVAAGLEGDFVECGVNRGGYARAVMEYVGFDGLDRTFWLLDTFEGLDERYVSESERTRGIRPGGYAPAWDFVVDHFRDDPVRLIRGAIPDTLDQAAPESVAFISIDMNCVEPEIAAAEHFWERLSPGAPMVLDDYGWARHVEQKRAFDAFAKERGVEVLSLPTGQGLILKA